MVVAIVAAVLEELGMVLGMVFAAVDRSATPA